MSDNSPLLLVDSLRKEFPTPAEPLVVLDGVSLQAGAGDSLAVMGPSGSGKSTLLHILGTLESPTSGSVRIHGRDPFGLPASELADFRNQEVGFIFQEHCLLPQLTALENVLTPTLVAPRAAAAGAEARARDLMSRVGLSERLEHKPGQMSGGERQRTAIARALINSPRLLLCDEPTGNLDQETAAEVGELLLELQRDEGIALIVVTHSAEFAERFSRTLELRRGKLEAKAR